MKSTETVRETSKTHTVCLGVSVLVCELEYSRDIQITVAKETDKRKKQKKKRRRKVLVIFLLCASNESIKVRAKVKVKRCSCKTVTRNNYNSGVVDHDAQFVQLQISLLLFHHCPSRIIRLNADHQIYLHLSHLPFLCHFHPLFWFQTWLLFGYISFISQNMS